jgi:uncharacterized protein (DUF2147 family)
MRAFLLCLAVLTFHDARAQALERDRILGEWVTAGGDSRIEIFRADSVTYAGKIVWLREPIKEGKAVVDDKNPEETLRSRPVMGLELLRGFTYDGDGEWTGGKIYDPKSGNDYSAKMTMPDDKNLDLRGYVLMPLFGRTERWIRP